MIIKERRTPVVVSGLQLLLTRLPLHYPLSTYLEDELAKYLSGHKGEQSIDFHLKDLPQKEYLFFHNLRIPHNDSYFQLDILILTPYYFFIIEVKNFSGKLYFDQDLFQLIRTYNGLEETFADPISQLKRQRYCLMDWLKSHHFSEIPVEAVVVISNPQTQIKVSPGRSEVYKWISHKINLPEKIRYFDQKHTVERLSMKDLRKLSKALLKAHTSPTPNLLQKYQISQDDIVKGVACPSCGLIPMVRNKRKWFCPSCKCYSRSAHIQALKDYSLLFGSTITNSQFRDFIQLESRTIAKKLLLSMDLPTSGELRHRKYHLDFDDWRD
ncbi:NERD domain-containing protein [Fictibacillus sp. 23RED33]|uniref:NERD domain-containing protein n=1 Tax=Fictibacillus sp. 23RED33 TaxID=2745879 RepID=UPI0018CFC116|nr:NERD domain-containing protein [Fictibacillus sp. 23RED33]MBH0173775.1 NERD domain-containing protein [Fictibacillus sp. 23RED33]